MLNFSSNEMSTLQTTDESQKDVVVLDNCAPTVADEALSNDENNVRNDDDMSVMAVSNVACMDDVLFPLNKHSHSDIFTSDDKGQRIVNVLCSDASDCVVSGITRSMIEVTSSVLIPSLIQLAHSTWQHVIFCL